MENLGLLLQISLEENFVGLFFGFAENNGPAVSAAIEVDDISDD